MTSVLSIALFTQLLLVLSGLAVLQLVNGRERIQIWWLVPYAWGVGSVLLFIAGYALVPPGHLAHDWHLVVAGGMAVLIVAGAIVYCFGRADCGQNDRPSAISVRWYDLPIIALILVQVGLVTYICMVNSVIDSDATSMRGYMSLAKKIGEGIRVSEFLGDEAVRHSKYASFSPPLLPAFIRMFLDRWHDSVITLPWLLAWLFSGGIAYVTCCKLSRHFTASLVCAYLFLSLPLASIHVFRSGFLDLLVMYFFCAATSVLSLAFLRGGKIKPAWVVVAVIAVVGSALCKSEGKLWAVLLAVIGVNYCLHVYGNISWKKLIGTQVLLAAVLFLVYHFFLGKNFFNSFEDQRLQALAPHSFDKKAFGATLSAIYGFSNFGIWWWAFSMVGVYLLIARKVPENAKAVIFLYFSMFLAIIYFANFTENVKYTLIGTNVSRFSLQIAGVLLPVYCAAILIWLPFSGENTVFARRRSKNHKMTNTRKMYPSK